MKIKLDYRGNNQCAACGRFCKWENLRPIHRPDSICGPEETYFICNNCEQEK